MRKYLKNFVLMFVVMILLVSCGTKTKAGYTFEKGSNTKNEVLFNLKITGPNSEKISDDKVLIKGENANLMEVMKGYCAKNNINFEENGGLVLTIKDLKSDKEKGWLLYINDKLAEKGALEIIPNKDDKIEWKYLDYKKAFGM